jgi:hypothetical protein
MAENQKGVLLSCPNKIKSQLQFVQVGRQSQTAVGSNTLAHRLGDGYE